MLRSRVGTIVTHRNERERSIPIRNDRSNKRSDREQSGTIVPIWNDRFHFVYPQAERIFPTDRSHRSSDRHRSVPQIAQLAIGATDCLTGGNRCHLGHRIKVIPNHHTLVIHHPILFRNLSVVHLHIALVSQFTVEVGEEAILQLCESKRFGEFG